ncbi:DUF309 domain-containing protein [Desulfurobacterium crinifex]
MDLFEIRNWFAHNLCDYLREKENEDLEKLLTVIEVIEKENAETEERIGKVIVSEFPLIKKKNNKLSLNREELDPFTEEYLKEKATTYREFLQSLEEFEPVGNDIEKNIQMARKLFKAKLYFEVHELLEELWMGEFGKYREFLQALIQLGVAYYHLTNYNLRGFELLLKNARELLEPYSGEIHGVNVNRLKKELENIDPDKIIEF